jgi:F0F1-type ATP synthase assembly protein I
MSLPTLLGTGAMFGLCVGVAVLVGVLGDRHWGTAPLLALAGLAVGIFVGAAGAYQVIRPFTRSSTPSTTTTESARPDDSAD